jgi:hypothetical protein
VIRQDCPRKSLRLSTPLLLGLACNWTGGLFGVLSVCGRWAEGRVSPEEWGLSPSPEAQES